MRPRAVTIALLGVTGLFLAALAWGWSALALPREAALPVTYLDADRQEIASVRGDNGRVQIWVTLDHMPPSVVAAVIAAEDHRFMQHHGVDVLAVGRAALTNAREASVVRGASTITQQLARGLFLSRERTWSRKAREIAIAMLLELRYSKQEILEAYLNTVYLGQERDAAVLGVAAGARHLLGKNLDALRLDRRFQGPVTIRRALEASLNVPAALVAQGIGVGHVTRMARAVGIDSPLAAVPSLSLGTSEVTLLEMTAAFATIANGGVRVWPTTLDDAGQATLTPRPAPTRVVSAESAFIVTHLLRGVMVRGTGGASARWGLQEITAGKTGTTDGLRDAWFVGYTPDLVVGVWVGADDARPIGLTGADIALPIWADVMQKGLRRSPPSSFTPPPGIVMTSVDWDTGRRACGSESAISEAFRAGSEPQQCESVAELPIARDLTRWVKGLFQGN